MVSQPIVVDLSGEHARHDNNLVAVHIELFDRLAQDLLAAAVRVDIGGIESVDAVVVSVFDVFQRLFLIQQPTLPVRRSI